MTTGELQELIFTTIRNKKTDGESLAGEIAGLLNISTDSAYRRLRGDISLQLHELHKLCSHYQVSLDAIMGTGPGGIVFHGKYIDQHFNFTDYLHSVLQNMSYMNSFAQKHFYYLCKDLPIFHHYHVREIAAFKWFFWLRTYFEFPEFLDRKFRFEDHPDELFAIERQISEVYDQIPCVEIWNLESMNILFRQIDFYRQGGIFASNADIVRLYDGVERLWSHLEEQAALGYKFRLGDPQKTPQAPIRMYFNEVLLGDNNMMVELDGRRISYVSHTTINFMHTTDKAFNDNMYSHIQNQMRRSTLISEVGEKERARFFRIVREKIRSRREAIA